MIKDYSVYDEYDPRIFSSREEKTYYENKKNPLEEEREFDIMLKFKFHEEMMKFIKEEENAEEENNKKTMSK